MSREIKFRSWYKKGKTMTTSGFHLTHKGEILFAVPVEQNDFILMQYTGLEDKNGKEIYEGDIIKFDFDYSNKTFNGIVYYSGACFYANDGCSSGHLTLGHLIDNKRNVEVMGNVHENPDLLMNSSLQA